MYRSILGKIGTESSPPTVLSLQTNLRAIQVIYFLKWALYLMPHMEFFHFINTVKFLGIQLFLFSYSLLAMCKISSDMSLISDVGSLYLSLLLFLVNLLRVYWFYQGIIFWFHCFFFILLFLCFFILLISAIICMISFPLYTFHLNSSSFSSFLRWKLCLTWSVSSFPI